MSDIKPEENDISVFHQVILAFQADIAVLLQGLFGLVFHEVLIAVDLGTDKAPLEIRMDHTCALRCFHAFAECPCAALRLADREERTQAEQMVGGEGADELIIPKANTTAKKTDMYKGKKKQSRKSRKQNK